MKATQDGIERGIEQGLEQGKVQEKFNLAKNAISQGLDEKTISLITGLSLVEISKLRK
jgi:predicted transposase/invertase (TIGR01784 family)